MLHTALPLIGLTVLLSSCSGQNTARGASALAPTTEAAAAKGDSVATTDSCIFYILQAGNGDYWFGSNGNGVYRYSGRHIIHFGVRDGLCGGQVRGIQEDRAGNIYINTTTGVSKFDGRVFTTLKIVKSSAWRLHNDDLWFQAAQDSGVVYRYDGNTLHRLEFPHNREGREFPAKFPRSKYPHINFSPYDVYGIYRDRKDAMWFGTNVGLCRYDGHAHAWMTEKELGIDAIAFHVRSIMEDREGRFWFSNIMHRFDVYPNDAPGGSVERDGEKRIVFNEERGLVSDAGHDAAYFMSGLMDNSGNMWMATYSKGIWKYDGKALTHYQVTNNGKNVPLFSIYKDRKGELWAGTHTAGVYKFNGRAFEQFRP